jgi:phospholipid/cholesterol/gamma-HCH transport system permease protein
LWIVNIGLLLTTLLKRTGAWIYGNISAVGEIVILLYRMSIRIPLAAKNPELTLQQIFYIGITSIPLIFVASVFTGAVAAESAAYQFRNFIPDRYIGTAVCMSVILELGPVLTGLVLSGRSSSAISAEIGSMKEKEELDAMSILDLNPLRYLAMPRFLTCIIMFPVLTVISCFLAILGGWLDSFLMFGITTSTYIYGLRFLFDPYFVLVGITKSFFFGGVVALMGYYHGLMADGGAKGVGQAAMKAVVSSSVLILFFDFLITYLMLS